MDMIPYDDEGFVRAVETVLKPWLEAHVTGGTFSSFDGTKIQYYSAPRPDAKGVIVMMHGYCEFFGKFHETAHHFWEQGYTVHFIEHRGHGGSGRSVDDPDLVDVADFSDYVEDLKCFLDKVVLAAPAEDGPQTGKHLMLYAHSMGGCVGALFLEQYPEYFTAAVLTSPMLKMNFTGTPRWQVAAMMAASRLPGWSEKPVPGTKKFDPDKPDFEGSGTSSRARFDYQFDIRKDPASGGIYTMNRATYGWGRAALKATKEAVRHAGSIRIPVLVCQAGKDVYVDNEGQDQFVKAARCAKLVHFPQAEHEIYACDEASLDKYYRELDKFYKKASRL